MANNFAPEIRALIDNELADQGAIYSQDFLNNISLYISKYLQNIQQMENRWNIHFKWISVALDSESDLNDYAKRYIAAKDFIKNNDEIENILKQGYEIIDILRENYIGEKIKYSVGVSYKGKLYEGTLNLQDILSIAKIDIIWKSSIDNIFKLRLSGLNKSTLIEKLSTPPYDGGSTLYSSIRDYSKNKKWNEGNLYEAYKLYKIEQGSNRIPPAKFVAEHFEELLAQVRSNTTSFVKGGDILDESVKFFGRSMPSLASLKTIKTTLTSFNEIITQTNMNNIKSGLKLLFDRDATLDGIDLDLKNMTEEEVEKVVSILKSASKI